ncbi:MAG: DMT family transporter [Pseudomonadota bacterium]
MKIFAALNLNTRGILCLIGALILLTFSDSIIKWLSPTLPLHEITLIRAVVALGFLSFLIKFEGGIRSLKTRRPGLHFLRGSMLVLANMFFFLGLASMPLAETVTLFYTAPLFICILSKPVLGESVGWVRWMLILAGLAGVMMMLRPGSEVFNWISLLPIMAALSYAAMTMMTRKLGMADSAGTLSFYIQIAFIVISLIIGLTIGDGRFNHFENTSADFLLRAWVWPDEAQIKLLLACGFLTAFGGYFLSQAYRLGEAAAVAPFEYASLPLALIVGFYLWGDWPDGIAFIGSGLIIASGLFVVYLENQKQQSVIIKQT